MYVTCPKCRTVYVARAAMLRDGQGEVRCGACKSVFDALATLSDDLPAATADGVTPVAQQRQRPAAPGAVPRALRDDLERLDEEPRSPWRNVGTGAAAAVLLLAAAFQYLWFHPDDLGARFPQLRAPVERFCMAAGCRLAERRSPQNIRMLSRDVRAHPQFEGALLVTATFSNAAPWPQPFPRLAFSLYDVNGGTIAARVFEPRDYLAGVLPPDARLPPGQPVQIALEMLAPEEAAVSFEFRFL